MWIWTTIASAVLLGFYDVFKKQSLKKNGILEILFISTALSALFLTPFLSKGCLNDHLSLMLKAVLVTTSWISGMAALKLLPITTASTIKASRPVFVLLFSILLFGERLSALQWTGSILALASMFLLGRTNRSEGISTASNKGLIYIWIAVFTGVASALYDKHILGHIEPLFVQSWTNVYIAVLMGLCLLWSRKRSKEEAPKLRWDWNILLIAVFITGADFLYFYSLSDSSAMLSVVSMVRRSSVIVPFLFGALFWHEKKIGRKALILLLLFIGMTLIVLGT